MAACRCCLNSRLGWHGMAFVTCRHGRLHLRGHSVTCVWVGSWRWHDLLSCVRRHTGLTSKRTRLHCHRRFFMKLVGNLSSRIRYRSMPCVRICASGLTWSLLVFCARHRIMACMAAALHGRTSHGSVRLSPQRGWRNIRLDSCAIATKSGVIGCLRYLRS